MSAFVLNQEEINILTAATDAALRLNEEYPGSYPLAPQTVELLGSYIGDLHKIYRALYITNIKAVNGRYGEDQKTLPKYEEIMPWSLGRQENEKLRKACGVFGCYMYQCSEEPIYGSDIFNAFQDIYKLLCFVLVQNSMDWDGNTR